MRKDRQTLLFSATWPVEVQLLAERLLSADHVLVEVREAPIERAIDRDRDR